MPGWCGGTWTSANVCPDGSAPTKNRLGTPDEEQTETKGDGKPGEVTGKRPSYAVDPYVPVPRPVTGEALITTGSTPVRIPVFVDTSSPRGVKVASDINSILNADRYSKSDAESLWDQLPQQTQNALTEIAKSQGGRSGKALWERSVSASYLSTKQGNPQNPWDLIAASGGDVQSSGSGSRGGRSAAYSGPVQSVTVQAESDINATADAIAIELLGRGATEDEKKKILNRIRKAEQAQPQVTTPQGPGRQVTEQGLTTQGREDILRQVIAKNPDFVDYQLDTTVMDLMLEDIDRGKRVANV
jgi:hypothetical protein